MKHNIRKKVTAATILVAMTAIIIISGVTVYGMLSMKSHTVQTSKELGHQAGADSKVALISQAKQKIADVAKEKAKYIETKFNFTKTYVETIADTMTSIYDNPDEYPDRSVKEPVKGNTNLTAQLMFSSTVKDKNDPAIQTEIHKIANIRDILVQINGHDEVVASTYVATKSGIVIMADYISSAKFDDGSDVPNPYEAFLRPWYQKAVDEQKLIFTDIIKDIHGGGSAIICAKPFYKPGEFMGVAGVGSYLTDINDVVMNTEVGKSGYAFLIDSGGKVNISSKESGEVGADPDHVTDLRRSENKELADAVRNMAAGESGIAEVTIDGKKVYLAYEPLTTLGWSFATVIEQEEVIAPAIESQDGIMKLTNGAISQINQNIRMVFVILIVLILIVLLAIFFLSNSVSKKITDPIVSVTRAVQEVGDGDLEYNLEIHTGDETEELSNAFQEMTLKLKEYIRNLTAVTAEKERIGAELNVATQIQASMLPCIFPAFPEHKEFNVYATMQPAKEVGGDFYDFFLIDDNHLAVVMADVSGKGVPAALFMVIAKTLIKNHTQTFEAPCDVFTNVNKQLCENNQAGMFVTAWMGILEIDSGMFTYVNAGHNPPLLKRKGERFTYLKSRAGFVLAGMEGIRYGQYQIQLNPGDLLYLYTDGVTEATDIYNKLYGEERLQEILDKNASLPLEEILKNIKKNIDLFVKGAPQFDDITMLALKIHERE